MFLNYIHKLKNVNITHDDKLGVKSALESRGHLAEEIQDQVISWLLCSEKKMIV